MKDKEFASFVDKKISELASEIYFRVRPNFEICDFYIKDWLYLDLKKMMETISKNPEKFTEIENYYFFEYNRTKEG